MSTLVKRRMWWYGNVRRLLTVPLMLIAVLALILAGTAYAQAPTSLYGPNGVSPMAVKQGKLGSCYFHASLAAVAQANPSAIRNAISGNAQSGYKVHFASGSTETVLPEDVEYALEHKYDRSEGQWVAVLMRAYAQRSLRLSMVRTIQNSPSIPLFVREAALSALDGSNTLLLAYDRAIRAVVNQDGQLDKATLKAQLMHQLAALGLSDTQAQMLGGLLDQSGVYDAVARTVHENGEVFGAYRGFGQGGIPVSVIAAFLGNAHSAAITDPALVSQLRLLHSGGTALVAGTKPIEASPTLQAQASSRDWYVASHAYTVLDYDSASQTVLLRNPWGERPAPDGVFKLPLAVFQQTYETYSFSAAH